MQSNRLFWPLCILVALSSTGCDTAIEAVEAAAKIAASGNDSTPAVQVHPAGVSRELPPADTPDTIRIASFNIQVFGPTKLSNDWAMQRIAAIIRQFDVVAIQEIRSQDQGLMDRLLNYVNADGSQYQYLLGERQGRTVSKEQYAYAFNSMRVRSFGEPYTVQDPEDWLHREPYVARFATISGPGAAAFTFTLANVHTDPDEVDQELQALARVYHAVAGYEAAVWGEDDVLMLGDFNADSRRLNRYAANSGYTAVIDGEPTNVAGTAQYDNVLLNFRSTSEFTGRSGVFDFARQFELTASEAKQISDHLPVWCEFTVSESGGPVGYPVSTSGP